jgi:putative ABC transport system permease protein
MLKYNIKSAIKNLLRFRNHTVISLLGLIIGLACVFIIAAWAIQESQYDKFHKQPKSIYMVTTEVMDNNTVVSRFPETPPPLASTLSEVIPEIEKSFHFVYLYGGRDLKIDNDVFKEIGIAADSKFLEVFNFPLLKGNAHSLEEPNSILICESLAQKLFPNEEAIGKSLMYRDNEILSVQGVLKDIPENSSLQFQYILSYQIETKDPTQWWNFSGGTFIKIRKNADLQEVKKKTQMVFSGEIKNEQYGLNLVPITKLRYGAEFEFFNAEHGSKQRLILFIGVAFLILVLACLNYINLIAAYALKLTKVISIRKVNGASRKNLMGHFLSESIFLAIIAWIFSVILSKLLIHFFQSLLDVQILNKYLNISFLLGFFVSFIVIGIISGYYPAFLSSSIVPFKTRNSKNNSSGFQGRMNNAFVLSQFILSITLTVASLVFIQQTNFLNKFDVGYNAENVVLFYLPSSETDKHQTLRNKLEAESSIERVGSGSVSPINMGPIVASEDWAWDGLEDGTPVSIYRISSDHNYLDIFDIPLLQGRNFYAAKSDSNKVVINEELATLLNFDDPVGKVMKHGEDILEIIGVVRNFHFQHLSNIIQPLYLTYSDNKNRMYVRFKQNSDENLNLVKEHFTQLYDSPFSYYHVDGSLDELYSNERKISKAILIFTIVTIILSSIGLVGLITFNTESKMKEIGVRKVLGAKISEIVLMLNKGIMKWFAIAFLLSCILSWFAMSRWLEDFAYRVSLSWWIFATAGLIIILITTLTISMQSSRAARKNPVDVLRSE